MGGVHDHCDFDITMSQGRWIQYESDSLDQILLVARKIVGQSIFSVHSMSILKNNYITLTIPLTALSELFAVHRPLDRTLVYV